MTGLYDILKANRLGRDSDPWVAILGEAWKASEEEYQEYTGLVPYTFVANGQPLIDWYIKGNEEHTGTPSPQNPVMPQGCGDKTNNLWNEAYTGISSSNVTYFPIYVGSGNFTLSTTARKTESPNPSRNGNANIFFLTGNVSSGASTSGNGVWNGQNRTVTATDGYVTIAYRYLVDDSGSDPRDNDTMLNTGSTAKPYEPYGYKIPIPNGGVTTNIYLGSTQTVRQIYKYVCTGDEDWSNDFGASLFIVQGIFNSAPFIPQVGSLSTHYTYNPIQSRLDAGLSHGQYALQKVESQPDRYNIAFKNTDYTDTTNFKAYLAQQYANGTPVTICYVLATPTTAAVNEPLMKIGDYADSVSAEQAGVEIPTIKGNNTLDIDTDVKPSEVYIKYKGR